MFINYIVVVNFVNERGLSMRDIQVVCSVRVQFSEDMDSTLALIYMSSKMI